MTGEDVVWTKSSFSGGNGNCVEVGWKKSSFSGAGGDCVEVSRGMEFVYVRDSKDPHSPELAFTLAEWQAHVDGAKAGEFDLR